MIRLACATLSAEGFDYRGFAATFEMLPAAGFKYVEFNLWDSATMLPSTGRDLLERCHAKKPEDRYPSAREVNADLVALRESLEGQETSKIDRSSLDWLNPESD